MFRSSEGACSAFDFARVVSSLARDLVLLYLDRVCFENIGICLSVVVRTCGGGHSRIGSWIVAKVEIVGIGWVAPIHSLCLLEKVEDKVEHQVICGALTHKWRP